MFVETGWGRQGSRHGRFQWFRLGLISIGSGRFPSAAVGSGANAVAGGSASAHFFVIACGAGQISTTGCQREVDEASVFY